uniref:Solute carrier organic anion transporter family member n=1 Tax=Glossina austeni TaxID=7395 RepID=A0A1A9UJ78_GLOAU
MHRLESAKVEGATLQNYNNLEMNTTTLCSGVENKNARLANDNLPNGNGHNKMTRRDSTHAWTPLLANPSGNINHNQEIKREEFFNESKTDLCTETISNNNDWKDSEEVNINGIKNDLIQKHTNNNELLGNGNSGKVLSLKYEEQDPLTGLCKTHVNSSQVENSNRLEFYAEPNANTRNVNGCGLFGCRPKWARRLASTNMFMVVFLLAYILQGMYMTYFVSVITTIEKLFQIKSKTTGVLLSASEMGQISTAMLLTYFAGRGHRPRWIACGMVMFSVAAFACALPHFIFGEELVQSAVILSFKPHEETQMQTLSSTSSFNIHLPITNASLFETERLSHASIKALHVHSIMELPNMNLCQIATNSNGTNSDCNENRKLEQASHSKITIIVLCIFFASLLSSGIGQTAVATLGIPYIDDNVSSKQSPMYMAITIGVRILGPASGFIVGSFCTRWYVTLANPGFNANDPRWIGAWWLGPVIIGSLMLLSSIAMFSFPKQLHSKKLPVTSKPENDAIIKNASEPEEKPKLKDFPKTVRRQLSNDILMFRTASCVFHLLPISGLYIFLPKYLETQFRLAPYDANMIAAFCGILVMGVGIVVSGLAILKLKPTAKAVAAWIAITALIYSAGMLILMFVGCNMNDFAGYEPANGATLASIKPACNATADCTCDKEEFAPICGIDGKIYISSCHAGCSIASIRKSDNHTIFSNCVCIENEGNNVLRILHAYCGVHIAANVTKAYEAESGYCTSNCKNFLIFIFVFVVCVFVHSTSEVGSMLLVMRCTHPKDKSMAMGVIQSAIGLFGNVPCPIIYGAVVDSACVVWKSVCGKHGACSLYDADSFRHFYLGMTAGIMFLAFIMDLVVWSKAHRIDIEPEEHNENKSADIDNKSSSPNTSV